MPVVPRTCMPTPPLIASTHGLTLRLGRRTVLYDVHLNFRERRLTAIMGPGGSGKSTLGRLLAGRLPESGELEIFGRLVRPSNDTLRLVTQQRRSLALSLRALLMEIAPKEMAAATDEDWHAYLRGQGFDHLTLPLDASSDLLSRADQQILRVAAAVWSQPELLILDEPFAELFDGAETELMSYIRGLKGSYTIILIEHHQGRARELSDELVLLAAGQVLEVSETEAFFTAPTTEHGAQFIRTGGCSISSIDAKTATLEAEGPEVKLQRLTELAAPTPSSGPVLSDRIDTQPNEIVAPPDEATSPPDVTSATARKAPNTGEFEVLDPDVGAQPSAGPPARSSRRPTRRQAAPPSDVARAEQLRAREAAARAMSTTTTAAPPSSPPTRITPPVHVRKDDSGPFGVVDGPAHLEFRRPPAPPAPLPDGPHGRGPQGFRWMIAGELAGAPRPGIVEPISRDLDRLVRTGTQVLVTLTQTDLVLEDHDLARFYEHVFFPVVDMDVPPMEDALALVRKMEAHVQAGRPVTYHCRAGLGRTGTLLVMHLIGRGLEAGDALREARSSNAYWVQSDAQEAFLHRVPLAFLRNDHGTPTLETPSKG